MLLLLLFSVEARDPRRGAGGSATEGPDIFLKGKFMEVAINPGGGFGSRSTKTYDQPNIPYRGTSVPEDFHPRVKDDTGSWRLGVVVDWEKNGWNSGDPAYSGDFVFQSSTIAPETGWHLFWRTGKDYR